MNYTCNGLRSVLQLSDDDSTSITKPEERKRKQGKKGQHVVLVSVCPDGSYRRKGAGVMGLLMGALVESLTG